MLDIIKSEFEKGTLFFPFYMNEEKTTNVNFIFPNQRTAFKKLTDELIKHGFGLIQIAQFYESLISEFKYNENITYRYVKFNLENKDVTLNLIYDYIDTFIYFDHFTTFYTNIKIVNKLYII